MPKITVDTAVELIVNAVALTDDTDFKSREVSIAYNASGMDLVWNFVTTGGVVSQTAITPTTGGDYDWAHVGDGIYKIEIPASGGASVNNDTEGTGWFTGLCDGVLPWTSPIYEFVPANVANSLVNGSDYLEVDSVAIGGSTGTVDNVSQNIGYLDHSIATVDGNVDTLVSSILSTEDSDNLIAVVNALLDGGRLDVLFDSILEDTGTTLPAAIAAGAVAGGSGSTLRNEIHRLAGIDEGTIYDSDLLFDLEVDETAATWPARPQKIDSTWYLFYTAKVSGKNRIRLKTSPDGMDWSRCHRYPDSRRLGRMG
jgi:hypothetical protein